MSSRPFLKCRLWWDAGTVALIAVAVAGCAPTRVDTTSAPPAAGGLTMELAIPPDTPSGVTVYVAGNFNGWNPGNRAYALARRDDGLYTITLPDSVRGALEFKFTLGMWEAVELTDTGGDAPNRGFTVPPTGGATYRGMVARWRDPRKTVVKPSTVRATVSVIDTAFAIPQLGRRRRLWIYLPPDYGTSTKTYPVIYMHDGQNVFDNATSFAGEWGVDETLDSLHAAGDWGAIVVATDHGGARRFDEYSPWKNAKYGGGHGDLYALFLVATLKPYIDQRYRTRRDRLNTAVVGSSMGGLISLYAMLRYPMVFGRAGVFSPAFWVAPESYVFARSARPTRPDPRIYFVSGGREAVSTEEAGRYVADQRRMIDTLRAAGFNDSELRVVVQPEGTHSEGFWRREFPAAYRWLFR